MQTAQHEVIALARQVRRRKRDDMVPRCRDDTTIEIGGGCKPIHVTIRMGAKLRRRGQTPTEEFQAQVRQPGATVWRRKQHDTTELSRASQSECAAHNDGPHAMAAEMKPRDASIVVKFLYFGCEPRGVGLN